MKKLFPLFAALFVILAFDCVMMRYRISTYEKVIKNQSEQIRRERHFHDSIIVRYDSLLIHYTD